MKWIIGYNNLSTIVSWSFLTFLDNFPGYPFRGWHPFTRKHIFKRGSPSSPSRPQLLVASRRGEGYQIQNQVKTYHLLDHFPHITSFAVYFQIRFAWPNSQVFFAFDELSEFTVAEKGLVVSTMKVIEDKTGCVQFRKVQTSLQDLEKILLKIYREVAVNGVVDLVLITTRPGNGWMLVLKT